jgi:hypothetical protein
MRDSWRVVGLTGGFAVGVLARGAAAVGGKAPPKRAKSRPLPPLLLGVLARGAAAVGGKAPPRRAKPRPLPPLLPEPPPPLLPGPPPPAPPEPPPPAQNGAVCGRGCL